MLQVDLPGTLSGNVYIWGIKHYTDMHTDAQSAKKDVISTKPQKGRASRGPKKAQRSTTEPPCEVTLAKCRRYRGTVCFIPRDIFGLRELKSDVKRPLAASTRRSPGRSPLRRAARARVARASDRHRSPLSTLCPRTADAQARGRARAVALRTPPSTRARSRSSQTTLSSE